MAISTNNKLFKRLQKKLQARIARGVRFALGGADFKTAFEGARRVLHGAKIGPGGYPSASDLKKSSIHAGIKPIEPFIRRAVKKALAVRPKYYKLQDIHFRTGTAKSVAAIDAFRHRTETQLSKIPNSVVTKAALKLTLEKTRRWREIARPGSLERGVQKRKAGAQIKKLQAQGRRLGLTRPGNSVRELTQRLATRKAKLQRLKTKAAFRKVELGRIAKKRVGLEQRRAARQEAAARGVIRRQVRDATRAEAIKLGIPVSTSSVAQLKIRIARRRKILAKRK